MNVLDRAGKLFQKTEKKINEFAGNIKKDIENVGVDVNQKKREESKSSVLSKSISNITNKEGYRKEVMQEVGMNSDRIVEEALNEALRFQKIEDRVKETLSIMEKED